MCGWFQIESLTQNVGLFSKYDSGGNKRSISISVLSDGKISVLLGHTAGTNAETVYSAGTLVIGRFYHFGFTYQDSDKAWKLVVWDDTASSKIINASGTAANAINVEDAPFTIGAGGSGGGTPFDGEIDEVVVFKDILTTGEIDEIRQGVYGA